MFGAEPTPVWPCKQQSRVALHGTARCSQIDLVSVSIRLSHFLLVVIPYISTQNDWMVPSIQITWQTSGPLFT